MTTLGELAFDPADMPALRRRLAALLGTDDVPFELARVEVGPEALRELPGVLADLAPGAREVVLVQDPTPMRRAGEELKPLVGRLLGDAGLRVRTVELAPGEDGDVHADEAGVEQVLAALEPGVPVVALGSGTVTDVTKHACFRFGEEHGALPLVFCATANSMLAYSARFAVISQAGVKRTAPSRLSDVLVQDTTVLRDAPAHTALAGIGDIAPYYVALGDWYVAHRFGLGRFEQPPVDMLEDIHGPFVAHARAMGERTPEGTELLSRLLTLAGLAATVAGESAPLSGYEHVTGHMLDMGAAHFGRGVGSHGSQVGMGVLVCTVSFNLLLDELDPAEVDLDACYPSAEAMEERVRATFAELDPSGAMGEECWADYRVKLAGWHDARDAFASFLAGWERERARLRELVPGAEECVGALARAGLPLRWEDLPVPIPEAQARWAFAHAHLMRKRFSHADLLHFLGWFDEAFTERVFGRMHELAASAGREG